VSSYSLAGIGHIRIRAFWRCDEIDNSGPAKRGRVSGGPTEEIADAIVFVASDEAAIITAQIIRVNGGETES
jgi:NAD(P)-dependent dehydrogenase (short-subunit alcohol dehydrogenase family)